LWYLFSGDYKQPASLEKTTLLDSFGSICHGDTSCFGFGIQAAEDTRRDSGIDQDWPVGWPLFLFHPRSRRFELA
jgi:hypothetical protein